jgi:hypothetical protein
VPANGTVNLSATATDPNNQTLTYVWTVLNPNGTTYATLTGSKVSFTAPAVTAAQGPITMTITLKVSNPTGGSASSVAAPAGTAGVNRNISLIVNPPAADVLANNGTLYRTSKSRLTVNVTSTVVSPSIVLTATLDTINPATGLHYTATLQNLGGGAYTVDFIGVGLPNTINVVSTGGGTLTITQAQIAVRQ